MAFFKRKSVITIICVLIGTMLFSAISLCIWYVAKDNKKEQPSLEVEAAYSFDKNGDLSGADDSDYTGNSSFAISSKSALKSFSNSVTNGCNFEGKEVYLTDNISMSGENWQPIGASMDSTTYNDGPLGGIYPNAYAFTGFFDGRGFVVSNLTTTIDDSPWNSHFTVGFFACISGGTIKNLKISNFTVNLTENDGYAHVGSIAGGIMGGVAIENCEIVGFKIDTKITKSFYSGIVGAGSTIMTTKLDYKFKNIILKNFSVSGDGESSSEIKTFANVKFLDGLAGEYPYTVENYLTINCEGDNLSDATHINSWNNSTKTFETDNSIKSSTTGENGTVWYYSSGYNKDYPALRTFITWDTLYFESNNTKYGTISPSSIQLPREAFMDIQNYEIEDSSPAIIFYDQTVTATAKSGHYFDGWTLEREGHENYEEATIAATYTATFNKESYTLKFATITLGDYTYAPDYETINVNYNTRISTRITYSATSTIVEYQIHRSSYNESITYTLEAKYTIKEYGSINSTAIGTNVYVPDLTHNTTYTITPTIELRQHSSEFN